MKKFGEIFKTFREARGLRLKDVAKAGISTSQLSRFEKGEMNYKAVFEMTAYRHNEISRKYHLAKTYEKYLDKI